MSNEYPYASMRDSFDLSAYFVVGPEDCKGRPLTDVVDQALHGGATSSNCAPRRPMPLS